MQASPSSLKCVGDRGNFVRSENSVTPFSNGTVRHLVTAIALAGIFSLIAVALAGCGGARPIRYYQLSLPADATAGHAATDPYPITLVLTPFFSSHLYREDRIVFGNNAEGMGTYDYQRWAAPPTEMIQAMMIRQLRNAGRFREVYAAKSAVRGDYLLRGQLYDFKEVSGGSLVARVSFDMELRDTKTNLTVWRKSYNQDEPVTGKTPADVVAALDKNIDRGIREVTTGLDQYFSANPPKTAEPASGN
jgi:ABC-type uncharacterized transport system auxiliary subunit